jgi:hypothetical protein
METDRTDKACTECKIEELQENLPWLKELINKAETDKTGNYWGTIWLSKYKAQDVFVTDMMLGSGGVLYWTFDCDGNVVYIDRSDAVNFFEESKKGVVLYVNLPF